MSTQETIGIIERTLKDQGRWVARYPERTEAKMHAYNLH